MIVKSFGNVIVPGLKVQDVQNALVTHGLLASSDVDGIWGPKTLAAVKAFQAKSGLAVDGVVGPATAQALQVSPQAGAVTFSDDEGALITVSRDSSMTYALGAAAALGLLWFITK